MTVLYGWKKTKKRKQNKSTTFALFGWKIWFSRRKKLWFSEWKLTKRLKLKRLNDRKLRQVTHAYVHRLADVHFAGFAPAFSLSLCDSEYARKPPVPIASVVRQHSKKKKKTDLRLKNLWWTVRFFWTLWLFGLTDFAGFGSFALRTIPRRFSMERIWLIAFQTMLNNEWNLETDKWKEF